MSIFHQNFYFFYQNFDFPRTFRSPNFTIFEQNFNFNYRLFLENAHTNVRIWTDTIGGSRSFSVNTFTPLSPRWPNFSRFNGSTCLFLRQNALTNLRIWWDATGGSDPFPAITVAPRRPARPNCAAVAGSCGWWAEDWVCLNFVVIFRQKSYFFVTYVSSRTNR